MDPNACLREALTLARRTLRWGTESSTAEALAERVIALDTWIRGGGFLPSDWQPTAHPSELREEGD